MTIKKGLVHFDWDGECRVVDPDRLESIFDPVVILGDPGMGKTTLLRRLCEREGGRMWEGCPSLRGQLGSVVSG